MTQPRHVSGDATEGPRVELIGYTDRFTVAPGEPIEVKVSVSEDRYDAALVRLLHGDDHPDGPGFRQYEVGSPVDGEHRGQVQQARCGSYVVVAPAALDCPAGFTLSVWVWPTLPVAGHRQTIAARGRTRTGRWSLALDATGHCEFRVGDTLVRTDRPLPARRWLRVTAVYDAASARCALHCAARDAEPGVPRNQAVEAPGGMLPPTTPAVFLLAASEGDDGVVVDHFNGKLESPVLIGRPLSARDLERDDATTDASVLAAWDFGACPEGTLVRDTGPRGQHGRTVNRPDRAMTGHLWDGAVVDHRAEQYAAMAFHDDDLDDAGWETDFTLTVPDTLHSGVYAIRVRVGDAEDHMPFVVRPPRDRATAAVALVIPTFSYMAYANDHVLRLRDRASNYTSVPIRYDPLDDLVERHREWGCSLYDQHRDGTGVAVSSRLRPMVNLRPRYRWWASGAAQYLAADLYIVDWLAHIGVEVDVITDEDVQADGAALLSRYATVLTGTHPEYVTGAILDALEGYLAAGGRLMYLGGNGFYWVTCVPPEGTHLIEVRRGHSGTRAWESQPGEEHHAFTGERGGLWRHRGRSPNRLVGVGFAAQGWSNPSPGYHRTAASHDPAVSWIFDGVDGEVIGDFGLAMGGAAGDELDRYDEALGSPRHAVVLASSRGHDRQYAVAHEDILQTTADVTGETNPNVRADLTYVENDDGGAVFSVGSKSWCASLSWNGYDNSVARVSENVLRRFMAASPSTPARAGSPPST